ncbi:MAG: hypothetical protein GXO88_09950 [Chlorobi bacterium]|nr:hypothetical protein [Chlorobiota bacterium]
MNGNLKGLITKIRGIANKGGIEEITIAKLMLIPEISEELKKNKIVSNDQIVEYVLESERQLFEDIFLDNNFDNNQDAIDILFTVSREMASKFFSLSPSVTYKYKELYPVIFQKHIEKRIDFIFKKISINLRKGISQELYRSDVSIELVARLYISRLIDLHNPDNFPPQDFSFNTIFMQMFESFVKSVATEKGIRHFKHKKAAAKADGMKF